MSVTSRPVSPVEPSALDLAALLASRLCHDVIGPVGAIVNGLEVIEEDDSEETRAFAISLINKSARVASAKLQFARLAFGAAGSSGEKIGLGEAERLARVYGEHEKPRLSWQATDLPLDKTHIKLVLNLYLIALSAVPRGGDVALELSDQGVLRLTCSGERAGLSPDVVRLIEGRTTPAELTARSIQPYYTGLLARTAGVRLRLDAKQGGTVVLEAHLKEQNEQNEQGEQNGGEGEDG